MISRWPDSTAAVDGERRRLGVERDVERDEHHGSAAPRAPCRPHSAIVAVRRALRITPGRSFQLGVWRQDVIGRAAAERRDDEQRERHHEQEQQQREPDVDEDAERDQDCGERERGHEDQQPVAAYVPEERVVLARRDLPRVPRLAACRARPPLAVGEARGRPAVAA